MSYKGRETLPDSIKSRDGNIKVKDIVDRSIHCHSSDCKGDK